MSNKRPACYAPWVTTYEYSTGEIVPCCEWQGGSLIKTREHMSLEDRFNHPAIEKVKSQLLAADRDDIDTLPTGCKHCKKLEKAGNKWSMRKAIDQTVQIAENDFSYKFNPNEYKQLWLDYRESNLCNFSCKMCGSALSSTHAKIKGEFGKTGIIKNPHKLQMYLDRLDEVTHVMFLGGEPVLTDSMYIILKEIRKRNLQHNINMNITTNGSLLHRDSDNLLELLEGFKNAFISISVDAVGDQHNYWRQKGSWDAVYNNTIAIAKWVNEQPRNKKTHTTLGIRSAIGWPNSYGARYVFDWVADELTSLLPNVKQRWNLISTPNALSLEQLPQDRLDDLVVWWKNYPDVSEMFKRIKSNPNNKASTFINGPLLDQDKWHKNSFIEAFPEFEDFYNKISIK